MKIQTKIPIYTLNGKEVKDGEDNFTVGKAISNILISSDKGGKMKLFILAKKFFEDEEVEVDGADLNLIKSEIENPKNNTLVAGQLLMMIDKLKEEDKIKN